MYTHFDQQTPPDDPYYPPSNVDRRNQQMVFSYRGAGGIVALNERVRTNLAIRPKRVIAQFADINGDGVLDFVTNKDARSETPGAGYGSVSTSGTAYTPGYGDGSFETKARFSGFSLGHYWDIDQWTAFDVGVADENKQVSRGDHNIKALLMESGSSGWSSMPFGQGSAYPNARAIDRFPLFADINGDGLADAVVPFDFIYQGVKYVRISIWLNLDGNEFVHLCPSNQQGCALDAGPELMLPDGHPRYRIAFADMDASGTTDIVIIPEAHGPVYWSIEGATQDPNVTQPKVPAGLLRHMDNGVGLQTDYTYNTVQNLPNHLTWTHQSPAVTPVVTAIKTAQTLPTLASNVVTYKYTNPAYDPWTRRLTGFEQVEATQSIDSTHARRTTTDYYISPCFFDTATTTCPQTSDSDFQQAATGRPSKVRVSGLANSAWVDLSQTTYHYDNRPLYNTTAGGRKVWFAFADVIDQYIPYQAGGAPFTVSQTVVTTYGEQTTTVVVPITISEPGDLIRWTKEVDEFGNTKLSTAHGRIYANGAPIDSPVVTQSTYERDPEGRPWAFNIIEQSVSPGGGQPERITYATFKATSRDLLQVDMLLGGTGSLNRVHAAGAETAPLPTGASFDGRKTVATFNYDPFGNIVSAQGPARPTVTGTKASCVGYTYDSDYANFPVTTNVYRDGCSGSPLTTNAIYDRGFGQLLAATNADFEQSSYVYDGFGRVTAAYGPDPTSPMVIDLQPEVKYWSDPVLVDTVARPLRPVS